MVNRAIASYAILKVNWEQPDRRDYLDNFVLLAAEAIRQLPQSAITLADVQCQIQKVFGLDLPQNTIRSLLNRVRKKGFIEIQNGVFLRKDEALANLNFRDIQQKVLKAHDDLIDDLAGFAEVAFHLAWSHEEADVALSGYMQQNQVELLGSLLARTNNGRTFRDSPSVNVQYIVGKYVQQLQETQSSKLDYLEAVLKGNLLANTVFYSNPSTYQRRFINTTVLLDTPLVMYALGYTGEPKKTTCPRTHKPPQKTRRPSAGFPSFA